MIGPKNRPASARPDSHLKLNTALHQLHPDFDGTRKFPRGRGIMPSFLLENIDGQDVTNENHEAFEQFVDLGVPLCRGAFTPSTRLVPISQ